MLILGEDSDRLAISVFHETQSFFSGHFNVSSIVGVNLNGRHYENLLHPVIIWFMRNKTNLPSKLRLHL